MTRPFALVLVALTASDAVAQPKLDRHGDPLPAGALMRLGTVRQRANVTGFGLLPDGTVVTVGERHDVRTWAPDEDASSFPIPIVLPGPRMYGYPQVSPDGSKVAVNTAKKVIVFARPEGALKKLAEFDIEHTRRMLFTPDGSKLFVVWHEDRHTRYSLGDIASGQLRDFAEKNQYAESVAVSGDGKRVATLNNDTLIAWDTETGKATELKLPGPRLGHIALNRTGDVVAASTIWEPYETRFFSGTTGKPIENLKGPPHHGWVTFAPDDKAILVGNTYGVSWWDPAANKLIRRFEGATNQRGVFASLARFTPDGKVLVANSEKALVRWDATTGKPLFASQDSGHHHSVFTLGLSPDGKTFVTGGRDGRIRTWDAATGAPRHVFESDGSLSWDATFSPDSRFLYGRRPPWGGPLKWDLSTGKEVMRFDYDPAEPQQSDPREMHLSPDGRTLTAKSEATTVGKTGLKTVWDAETGKRLSSTPEKPPDAMSIMFGTNTSPDGRWESAMHAVYPKGEKTEKSIVPADVVKRVTSMHPAKFSADSRLAVLVGEELSKPERPWGAVVVELATGAVVLDARGGWAAFGPDGRTLAVAEETDIVVWDVLTGKELVRYANAGKDGNGGRAANSLQFVANGTKLMTGHADTTALVWPVPPRPKAKPLDDAARTAAWDALAGADAAKAWAAVGALADDAGAAAFLKGKFAPVKLPPGKLPAGDALRTVRAIAALEMSATADAKALLADHANGPVESTAAEAKLALDRIGK